MAALATGLERRMMAAAQHGDEFRLTSPWGTDLRFSLLPGDVGPTGGSVRHYPLETPFQHLGADGMFRAVVGAGVTQTCEGVFVTRYCTSLGGYLDEPLT